MTESPTTHYAGFAPSGTAQSTPEPPADPSMSDKAAQSAQAGKEAAGEVAQTAVNRAQDVAAETKNQARNLVNEAGSQLRSSAADQHRNAAATVRTLSEELRSMAANSDGDGVASDLVGQAAGRASDFAGWLEARQPEDLLRELRSFASRRPGTFLLGALAAGVVAGRLTRGIVAVHSDETDGASDTQSGSAGTDAPTAQIPGYSVPPAAPGAPPAPPLAPPAPGGLPGGPA